MEYFDVAIIGAGPAGSSAAISLVREGYSVVLLDKERFPREKLCGDFLNPINWPLLREMEVDKELLACPHEKVATFRFTVVSGDQTEVPFPVGNSATAFGLGLRRADLDQVLLQKAKGLGVTVLDGCRLKELKKDSSGWRVNADRRETAQELKARVLIGADGRNSSVAHRLGFAEPGTIRGRSVGFQLRLKRLSRSSSMVEIHLFPGGYAGIVGVGGHTLNLCLAVEKDRFQHYRSPGRLLESCASVNPHLQSILRQSEPVGAAHSVYPVYFPPRRSYGHGVLLVGDAARVNEPVSGEGIYFALKSGQFAAAAIDQAFRKGDFSAEQLSSYERECRAAFRMRRGINTLVRWLIYRPALISPLVRFSGTRRQLLGSLVQTICQPETGC
jgi:geranylgeranyl reductase family protein